MEGEELRVAKRGARGEGRVRAVRLGPRGLVQKRRAIPPRCPTACATTRTRWRPAQPPAGRRLHPDGGRPAGVLPTSGAHRRGPREATIPRQHHRRAGPQAHAHGRPRPPPSGPHQAPTSSRRPRPPPSSAASASASPSGAMFPRSTHMRRILRPVWPSPEPPAKMSRTQGRALLDEDCSVHIFDGGTWRSPAPCAHQRWCASTGGLDGVVEGRGVGGGCGDCGGDGGRGFLGVCAF
jgi:hypothetical protein